MAVNGHDLKVAGLGGQGHSMVRARLRDRYFLPKFLGLTVFDAAGGGLIRPPTHREAILARTPLHMGDEGTPIPGLEPPVKPFISAKATSSGGSL